LTGPAEPHIQCVQLSLTYHMSRPPLREFDILVLQLLSEESLHGYAIKQRLESKSGHPVNTSSIYHSIEKLLQIGCVEQFSLDIPKGIPRKENMITPKGRLRLKRERYRVLQQAEERHDRARREVTRLQWVIATFLELIPPHAAGSLVSAPSG